MRMLVLKVLLSIFATVSVQGCDTELALIQNISTSASRFAVCGHGKCRGLLWRPHWIMTTAHCAEKLPVFVYHLHDEDLDCNQAASLLSDERRTADKISKFPIRKIEKADIAFVHLVTPYSNSTHINMMPLNYTRDYAILEELLDQLFQDVYPTAANKSKQVFLNGTGLKHPKKTPRFNIFATTFLIPLTFFLVLYLFLSFFSRNSPSPTTTSSNITGKYCLFRKSDYQDTYV